MAIFIDVTNFRPSLTNFLTTLNIRNWNGVIPLADSDLFRWKMMVIFPKLISSDVVGNVAQVGLNPGGVITQNIKKNVLEENRRNE